MVSSRPSHVGPGGRRALRPDRAGTCEHRGRIGCRQAHRRLDAAQTVVLEAQQELIRPPAHEARRRTVDGEAVLVLALGGGSDRRLETTALRAAARDFPSTGCRTARATGHASRKRRPPPGRLRGRVPAGRAGSVRAAAAHRPSASRPGRLSSHGRFGAGAVATGEGYRAGIMFKPARGAARGRTIRRPLRDSTTAGAAVHGATP